MRSSSGTVLAIILDDQGNPIAGPTDVNVLGRATLSSANAAVAAVSNASTPGSGYACGMHGQGSDSAPFVFASSSASGASNIPQLGRGLSTEPVDSSLLLRLTTRTEDGGLGCRTAYGLALGTGRLDAGSVVDPGPGAAGIELQEVTLTVDAIAVYRVEPAGCPTSIYR